MSTTPPEKPEGLPEQAPEEQPSDAYHDVVRVLCRLDGDVAGHTRRLLDLEDHAEGFAARVEGFAAVLDAIEALAAALPRPGAGFSAAPTQDSDDVLAIAAGDDNGHLGQLDLSAADTDLQSGLIDDQDEAAESEEGLDMRLLVDWVREHIALLIERKVPQTGGHPHWCRKWWQHPEAIARFESTRRAWVEAVTAGGGAMVIWFEHLDHQLAVLCAETGPFANCARRHAERLLVIDQDDPDDAYFDALERALSATSDHPMPGLGVDATTGRE